MLILGSLLGRIGAKEVITLLGKYLSETMEGMGKGKGGGVVKDRRGWVILEEKYFRRLEKFNGDTAAYRGWLFDLVMVLNQIDSELAKEVNKVIAECGQLGEKWDHSGRMDDGIWEKYHSELYGVISGLTEKTAKTHGHRVCMLKCCTSNRVKYDGPPKVVKSVKPVKLI